MQPAPIEASQNATSVESSVHPSSIQHGLPDAIHPRLGSSPPEGAAREPDSGAVDNDALSVSSHGTSRGRQPASRRMRSRNDSSQETSPGSRIDEYERAHAIIRKPSDGMIFHVVPSTKGKENAISIEEFPNEVLTHILSHLPPDTLSSMSLISRRFHKLVTAPPAWRIAFARYFPGSQSASVWISTPQSPTVDIERSQRRAFTRLSALASWRSEYILRTRLLRSLGRGKPALQVISKASSSRHGSGGPGTAVITYQSGLMFPVSHIHATFGVGLNKKQPLVMHGAAEQGLVSSSDPSAGKIASWGLGDFQAFKHFADLFPGEREYGLTPATVIGMPNVLDISQPFGKVYGEACPGGRLFYTTTNEQRGRFLPMTSSAEHASGIPEVTMLGCAVTSIWMAKSEAPLKISNGLFGIMAGFSNGVLASYALGTNPVYDKRFDKGEPTAKWVLCPGVPIIAIYVDDRVSRRRVEAGRIWLVVLNALGEVYYLTGTPVCANSKGKAIPEVIDRQAWQTGRTVSWNLVEMTRRTAKADPYGTSTADGSYSPRSSADAAGLGREQTVAETREIERFMSYKPAHFQTVCDGWNMRRKLVVDFAGDDRHGAGEAVFVIACGLEENGVASIRRFTRARKKVFVDFDLEAWPAIQSVEPRRSIFSGPSAEVSATESPRSVPRSRASSTHDVSARYDIEWLVTNFTFGDLRGLQLSAVATDDSELATLCAIEDPLLGMSTGSNSSSPLLSPLGQATSLFSPSDIPGHRARLLAVGTQTGLVLLWDMRASQAPASDIINTVQPVRLIYTRSPQISSLALTSLYVVHGGNDGLVQAWDPLCSTSEPIRTLNSRFSDRARRRIAQADASAQGVGHNYFAAGAIVLDPDPTILRGMVSLGTHLRYWSYSSTAADAYKSRKRGQLRRRSERGSNATTEHKVTATGRGLLKGYIVDEQLEIEREKEARAKESELMSGRYGTDLLGHGASDAEMLAYASMLSEESFASDEAKRKSSPSPRPASKTRRQEVADADFEEAIRLSLIESEQSSSAPPSPEFNIPIRYAKAPKHSANSPRNKAGSSSTGGRTTSEEDLEFALQLSLAEEKSKVADGDFPPLSSSPSPPLSSSGKGKGKQRRR